MKSEGIAVVLAFLFLGLGHLYAGKITRGLCLAGAGVAIYVLLSFLVAELDWALITGANNLLILSIGVIMTLIVWLTVLVLSIYDVYRRCREYNNALRQTGNPPW